MIEFKAWSKIPRREDWRFSNKKLFLWWCII